MARLLSQAEIDALLTAVPTNGDIANAEASSAGPVIAYNFRRPDRISKDQIRSLHLLHDRFARNMTNSLAAYLRTGVEVSVTAVEQFSYSEFLMSLPDPTAFYGLRLSNSESLGALEMNPAVAFTIVDRMLGGTARGALPDRALTEIEQTVVDSVVKLVLEHLTETWRPVMDVKFSVEGRETRPQMLPIAGRNDIMILLGFDVKVCESRGMLHICLPAAVVESAGLSFSHGWQQAVPSPTVLQRTDLIDNLGRVPCEVTAMLGARMCAREVLQIAVGDLISLGVPVRAPVNVRVGDLVKFTGRLTTHGVNAALQVEGTSTFVPGGRE